MTTGSRTFSNAGMVLLVPFMERLFRNMGYLDMVRFADEKRLSRAIALMQYMVTGGEAADEANLSLNRQLCGVPEGATLPPFEPLSGIEKQAGDQVLEAVIAHWPALEPKTPEGLRRLFLQREGTLGEGFSPKLHIAPQPQDTMLRELPWGYSSVRTPWGDALEISWEG